MPQPGTNLSFIREIPIGAQYEVHLAIGGWEEEKWVSLKLCVFHVFHALSYSVLSLKSRCWIFYSLHGVDKEPSDVISLDLPHGIFPFLP